MDKIIDRQSTFTEVGGDMGQRGQLSNPTTYAN